MKNPGVTWYPKDILSDPGVLALSLEAEGAWRRALDAIVVDGEAGSISRPISWWSGFLRVAPARAASLLAEIRTKRVGDVEPDPEADGVAACNAEITVSCRRLVRRFESQATQAERARAMNIERQRRWRARRCGKTALFLASRNAPRNARVTLRNARNAPQRSVTLATVTPQVLVASRVEECRNALSRSVTRGNASHARAALTQYQYTRTDSHPPPVPRTVALLATTDPSGGSLVRSGTGPGPIPTRSPSVRRCAPHDADRRAPTPMRELLAALVPTLAPASTGTGLRETECRSAGAVDPRSVSTPERAGAPYAIRDPVALAVRAWRSGKSPAGSGTWGLHVALRAAAHAIREGREQLRLFWHLLTQPLQAWCRAADDDQATAWMRQVRVRTC